MSKCDISLTPRYITVDVNHSMQRKTGRINSSRSYTRFVIIPMSSMIRQYDESCVAGLLPADAEYRSDYEAMRTAGRPIDLDC